MKNQNLFLLLALLLFLGCNTNKTLAPSTNSIVEFTILQINDVYEIAPIEGGAVGGIARVAHLKQQLLKENPNTIAVIAGDFLSPSLIATLKLDGERIAGLQMVQALNAMGMDYATFGNHEFDISDPEVFQSRVDQSTFQYVSCNAWYTDGQTPRPFTQMVNGVKKDIPPYLVHEFKGPNGKKAKVAIVGVVLPFNKADYVHYLPTQESFSKAYEAANKEADVVLGLTHLNMEDDIALAKAVPGLPLLMGGHEHVNLNQYIEKTIITKADANAKTAYVHRIKLDINSGWSDIQSTLIDIDASIPEEPSTKAVVDRWQSQVSGILVDMGFQPEQALMKTSTPLICTEALIRTQPTNFGQITVEAIQQAFPEVDVALINGGSMRLDDNLSGTITSYDILRTYPFGGAIVTMEVPGSALTRILNKGLVENYGEGGYFQIRNVSGQKDQWKVDGQKINPEQKYQLALPQFVAEGREARLELFADYEFTKTATVKMGTEEIKNDIRNMVIAYMLAQN